jgi:hypothetical protein
MPKTKVDFRFGHLAALEYLVLSVGYESAIEFSNLSVYIGSVAAADQ